MKKIVLLLFLT